MKTMPVFYPKLPVNLNSYSIGLTIGVTEKGGKSQGGEADKGTRQPRPS